MRIIGLFLLLTILLSCSHSTKPDDNDPFSISLKLVDNSGNPLQGYRVSITPNNYHGPGAEWFIKSGHRSYTTFAYRTVGVYKVNLRIYDYFNRPIRTIVDTTQAQGNYRLVWDGKNDEGNSVRDGVYKAEIKYFSGEEVVFSDICYPYVLAEIDIEQSPYLTDTLGKVYTEDITPFPNLYCNEQVKTIDEMGNELGSFTFSDTMKVTIESPNQESRTYIFQIINGRNVLNLNWDTMTQVNEKAKITAGNFANSSRGTHIKAATEPPFNMFMGNYPNPFN